MEPSNSPEDAGFQERRKDSRTAAVHRPVLIETEDFTGFCLLRNLSGRGMMGIAHTRFAADERVNVQFVPGHVAPGRIIWSNGGRIGVEFDEEIDLVGSLTNLGGLYADTWLDRSPRLAIECEGQIEAEGRVVPITVQDISQRGMKAVASSMQAGGEVVVRLPGMESHKAVVRWSQRNAAGLSFVRPIAFEAFARWVTDRQMEAEAERAFG